MHGDTGGEGLSSSTGEFLDDDDDDDDEEAFDALEIEEVEDLPPDLDLEVLSTLSSISFVWLERTGELDPRFEEPVLSV